MFVVVLSVPSITYAWNNSAETVAWYGDPSTAMHLNPTLVTAGRFSSVSAQSAGGGVNLNMVFNSGVTAQQVYLANTNSFVAAQAANDYIYANLTVGSAGLKLDKFVYNQVNSNPSAARMQLVIVDPDNNVTPLTNEVNIVGGAR